MALKNSSLNINLIFIVIIFSSISQFIKCDSEVDDSLLNYIDLVPLHYDVQIELDFDRNILFGACNITFNIIRQMINISIPSINFGIFNIDIINNNQTINVTQYSFIDKSFIYIDFSLSSVKVLFPDNLYILRIMYTRNIFDDKIFLGPLYNEHKGKKILTETGLEIIKAKQIFPCWDESEFDTTFTISIKHHKKYTTLSNMFINRKKYEHEYESDMMWTHFDKSPLMSIQHLVIVITTLTNISSENLTIWCRRKITKNILFAQDVIEKVMQFLNEYSKPKIAKIDYIVIKDVQHSNIKTWGLILHREEDISYNETLDSIAHKIKVANLVARQVISLWYDHVSWPMQDFVTYITAYILGKIPSVSYMDDLFVVQVLQNSFCFDISSYTNSALTIRNSTDLDTDVRINETLPNHVKPSVFWHVLLHFLSGLFWNGIQMYTYIYYQSDEIRPYDLWRIMQTFLNDSHNLQHINVVEYADIWMKSNYYPIIYTTQNYTNNSISFSYLGSNYIDEDVKQLPVLVTFATQMLARKKQEKDITQINGTFQEHFILVPYNETIYFTDQIVELTHRNYCVIVNLKQKGYYRVNYDSESWLKLAQCLTSENSTIPVLNQAQIIDDAFYFLNQKQISYTMFWKLVSFLSQNTNYIAWYPMIKAFEYMACIYLFDSAVDLTQNMKKLLNGVLQIIGYNENSIENDLTKCLREEAAKWACILGVTECKKAATLQLINDLKNPVHNNRFVWKEWIYCKGLMSANHTVWNHVREKWMETFDNRILDYLTCSQDAVFITSFLSDALGHPKYNSPIKEENKRVNILLFAIAKHIRKERVFNYILECIENKILKLGGNWQVNTMVILIVAITHIHSIEQLDKIKNFVRIHITKQQLFDAVKEKIKKQKLVYARQTAKFGSLHQHMAK